MTINFHCYYYGINILPLRRGSHKKKILLILLNIAFVGRRGTFTPINKTDGSTKNRLIPIIITNNLIKYGWNRRTSQQQQLMYASMHVYLYPSFPYLIYSIEIECNYQA